MSTAIGLFQPGSSPLHRAPAAGKLLGLVVLGVVVVAVPTWWGVLALLAGVLGAYAVSFRSPALAGRLAWSQARPLVVVLAVIVAFQVVVVGPARGAEIGLTLLTLVLSAGLVTLTTRTEDLVDVLQRLLRPLRRLGVDPERVGLSLALGIRSVPMMIAMAEQVREAQLARGLGASPRAFAVPLIVRALRRADAMAEALVARGALDDSRRPGSDAAGHSTSP